MSSKRFVFVGDRFPVLNRLIELGADVAAIFCSKNVFHAVPVADASIPSFAIEDKASLLTALDKLSFDVLVSNGCPYILPVSKLKKPHQAFINIHASLLPDFPGPHPINGAMLAGADGGATCHHMVDDVDSGEIISQVCVPNTPELDLGLFHLMTNCAEVDAFELAFERDFTVDPALPNNTNMDSYFKATDDKRLMHLSGSAEDIKRQIKAFGIFSQGTTFTHKGKSFTVFDAEVSTNPYLLTKLDGYQENQVAFIYDATVVIRKGEAFLQLKSINTDDGTIDVGDILSET